MQARSFKGIGFSFTAAVEIIYVFRDKEICFRRDSASTRESKNTKDSESKCHGNSTKRVIEIFEEIVDSLEAKMKNGRIQKSKVSWMHCCVI